MIESRDQRTLARGAFKMILKLRKARLRRLLQIGAKQELPCHTAVTCQGPTIFLQGFAHHRGFVMTVVAGNQIVSIRANSLKRRTLKIFEVYGALNPPAWAALAKFIPIRAAYSYLLRLHRFGLLNRTRDQSGLLLYSLSDRGRERLKWLTIPNGPKPSQLSPKEVTRAVTVPNAV